MDIKLEKFEIQCWGSTPTYSEMYSNDRQQCQVEVSILKQQWNDSTSSWEQKLLSSAELNSLKLVRWSNDPNATLPSGWSCDSSKNQYDQGLLSVKVRGKSQRVETPSASVPQCARVTCSSKTLTSQLNDQPEVHMRYIRSSKTETQKLMGRIKLDDGQIFTTNINFGGGSFESYVNINALNPYLITAADLLTSNTQPISANPKGDKLTDVDLYYYKLPNNLVIYNLTRTYDIGNWAHFYYDEYDVGDLFNDPNITYGAVYPLGTTQGKTIGGCHAEQTFSIDGSHTHFVASRVNQDECVWVDPPRVGNATVTVIDNFGCEHRYRLKPQNDGNTITVEDA